MPPTARRRAAPGDERTVSGRGAALRRATPSRLAPQPARVEGVRALPEASAGAEGSTARERRVRERTQLDMSVEFADQVCFFASIFAQATLVLPVFRGAPRCERDEGRAERVRVEQIEQDPRQAAVALVGRDAVSVGWSIGVADALVDSGKLPASIEPRLQGVVATRDVGSGVASTGLGLVLVNRAPGRLDASVRKYGVSVDLHCCARPRGMPREASWAINTVV